MPDDAKKPDAKKKNANAEPELEPGYWYVKEGVESPLLGCTPFRIVFQSDLLIVYVEKIKDGPRDNPDARHRFLLGHETSEDFEYPAEYAEIQMRCAVQGSRPEAHLSDRNRLTLATLRGEALALLLDADDPDLAHGMLDRAHEYYVAVSSEVSRIVTLYSTLAGAVVCGLAAIALSVLGGGSDAPAETDASSLGVWAALAATPLGGVGAFASTAARLGKMKLDPTAGRRLIVAESVARILVGVIAALIFTLAIQSDFVLGALSETRASTALLLLVALLAGASERALPSIVRRFDDSQDDGAAGD